MSDLTTTALSTAQLGSYSGGVWTETATPQSDAGTTRPGARYAWGLGDRPSLKSLLFTVKFSENGTVLADAGDLFAVQVYTLGNWVSTAFSDSFAPTDGSAPDAPVLGDEYNSANPDWVCVATLSSTGLDLTATHQFDLSPSFTDPLDGTLYDPYFARLALNGRRTYQMPWFEPDWVGDLHLALRTAHTGATPQVATVGLTAVWVPAFTGIEVSDGADLFTRAAQDMRTGLPLGVDQLTEDSYNRGVWTIPDQADPDDPRNEHPVVLPADEGERGDDVPA